MRSASASLCARSMPRVGSSRQHAPRRAAAEHDLERQPLALAAGEVARVRVAAAGQARRREPVLAQPPRARARGSGSRPGSGAAARRRPRASILPARRLGEPLQVAQQRRLAGAVATHQGNPLARREPQVDPAQDHRAVLDLDPEAAAAQRRRRPRRASEQRRPAVAAAAPAARPAPRSCSRACLTETGQRPEPGEREQAGDGRRELAAHRPRPRRGSRRGRRRRRPRRPRARHAVGGGQAALEPVLGDHDGRPPLLVEPAQQPDQLVARDRVELRRGLVEQQQGRAVDQRGGDRDALQLAARRACRCGGRAAARSRARARPPRRRARPSVADSPRCSSGSDSSARTPPITTCVSGSWKTVPQTAASSPGPWSRTSARRRSARPATSPPWKCGTSPQSARRSVDLPGARRPGEHGEANPASSSSDTSRSAGASRSG